MIKMQVIGNIGRDAEVKEVNGRKAINFTVASNKRVVDGNGEIINKTTWVSCAMWRESNQSTELAKYLNAGTKIYVEGYPEINMYKDAGGKTAASIKLVVTQVELLSAKKEDETE